MKLLHRLCAVLIVVTLLIPSLPLAGAPEMLPEIATSQPAPESSPHREVCSDCIAETDLWIEKSSSTTALLGEELTYTISLGHDNDWGYTNSNAAARNIVITDTLPAGVTYVSDYNEDGLTTVSTTGGKVVWTRPLLNPDEATQSSPAYITLKVRLATSPTLKAGDMLTNVVQISTSDPEISMLNNTYTTTTFIDPTQVNLNAQLSNFVVDVPRGEKTVYQLTVSNNGNFPAQDTVLSYTLPMSSTFVGWSTDEYLDESDHYFKGELITPTVQGQNVIWELGSVVPGSINPTIYAIVDIAGTHSLTNTIVSTATVSSSEPDILPADNVASLTQGIADPVYGTEVYKTVYTSDFYPGGGAKYWIIIGSDTNANAPTDGVVLKDILPENTTLAEWSTQTWYTTHELYGHELTATETTTNITWYLGTIWPHFSDGYLYPIIQFSDGVISGTVMTNTARITSTVDAAPFNNTSIVTNTILSKTVDMEIDKSVYGAVGAPGGKISYQLLLENSGTGIAQDVVLTDTLPMSTTLVDWSTKSWEISHELFGREITTTETLTQIVWHIGNFPTRMSAYIYLTLQVSDQYTDGASITNYASVATSDEEVATNNNSDSIVSTLAEKTWDVAIYDKDLAYNEIPLPGQDLTYYFSFSNYGNQEAESVKVTDTLPSNITFKNVDYVYSSAGGIDAGSFKNPTQTNGMLIWDIGEMLPDEQIDIHYIVEITNSAQVRDVLCNKVEISAAVDGDSSNNVFTSTHTIYGSSYDVSVSKYLYSSPGAPGGQMVYSIDFDNYDGAAVAQNVVITDTLPDGLTMESWTDSLGSSPPYYPLVGVVTPTIQGNQITWNIGALPANAYGYIYVTVDISESLQVGDILTNAVEITADEDWDLTDNYATNTVELVPPTTDLSIYKSPYSSMSGVDPSPGGDIVYEIYVYNYGNWPATNIYVTDTLPISLTYVTDTSLYDFTTVMTQGGQVVWTKDSLAPLEEARLYLRAHVDESADLGDTLTNEITVSSDAEDSNIADNTAENTVTIGERSFALYISKYLNSYSSHIATPGGLLTYSLSIGNDGNWNAEQIIVTDTLPISSTVEDWNVFIKDTGNTGIDTTGMVTYTYQNGEAVWDISELKSGGDIYIEVGVRLPDTLEDGDSVTNYAELWGKAWNWDKTQVVTTSYTTNVSTVAVESVTISGPPTVTQGLEKTFTAQVSPHSATPPINYVWDPDPITGQGTAMATYRWLSTGTYTMAVTASNEWDSATDLFTVTVTQALNSAPHARNDYALTRKDTPVAIDVLHNDIDLDGDTLTVVSTGTPRHGSLISDAGLITYTPESGYGGFDMFTYTVSDGAATDSARVEVFVVQAQTPLYPTQRTTDTYMTAGGLETSIDIPLGAVTETVELNYTEITTPTDPAPGNFRFAGRMFSLDITKDNVLRDGIEFQMPITIGLTYSADATSGLDLDTLQVFYFDVDSGEWITDGLTLVSHDPVARRVVFAVDHLTKFGILAEPAAPVPDLVLTKEVDAGNGIGVPLGSIITYTLHLSNQGGASAWQAVITDTLPEGLTFIQQLEGLTIYPLPNNTFRWGPNDIAAGETYTLTFTAQLTTSTSFDSQEMVNTAEFNADNHDVGSSNDARFIAYDPNVEHAPVFTSEPVLTATVGTNYVYNVTAEDFEDDAITITAPILPAWLGLVDNQDGTALLNGVPMATGVYPVTLQATDGVSATDQGFNITVVPKVVDEYYIYLPLVLRNSISR